MKSPEAKYIKTGILSFIFILPAIFGLFHAVHEHQSQPCFAKNEQHIHAQKESCAAFHILQNISFEKTQNDYELIRFEPFKQPGIFSCRLSEQLSSYHYLLRGPPVINALF